MSEPAREGAAPLEEMIELLKMVAGMRSPGRELAVRYTNSRAALLAGGFRAPVPGFLHQCVSVFKFHDFINLYAPDLESRIRFIDQAFQDIGQTAGQSRPRDIFGEDQ